MNRADLKSPSFRQLRSDKIIETVDLLARRIHERFPEANLYLVARELHRISQEAVVRAQHIRRANVPLRIGVVLLVALIVAVVVLMARYVHLTEKVFEADNLAQTFEASIGSLVFIGAAIVFLFSLELRMKRERALEAVRELRSLAHAIDMHQLTKDPERITNRGGATASSPKRTMTPFELERYLDYCSEMLSLVGKTAALYVQEFPDPVAIEAVDRLTNLTTDLSRNIWQKIMILDLTTGESPAKTELAKPEATESKTAICANPITPSS